MLKSTSFFPSDLISEILLKLLLKSVARFRCVSKLWLSITTDPYYTNKLETRSSTRQSLLVCIKAEDSLFLFSIPVQHENTDDSNTSSQPLIDHYHMKIPYGFSKNVHGFTSKAVHGLICFHEAGKAMIWNPTTRQFLTLPKPVKERRWLQSFFFGYDPIEGKHKVVCIIHKKCNDECRVFTLGSAQNLWRTVKTICNLRYSSYYHWRWQCIDGVLYYDDYSVDGFIMSFDVRLEKFDKIKVPWSGRDLSRLICYEGRLACVLVPSKNPNFWILENAEKHEWSCKHYRAPLYCFDKEELFELIGSTHAGEFLYVPISAPLKTFYIIYFDPKKKSFRRIELLDEEFRLRYGLGNKNLDGVHIFQNHFESLVSL